MDRVCLGSARRVPECLLTSQISEVPKPALHRRFQPCRSASYRATVRMRMREVPQPEHPRSVCTRFRGRAGCPNISPALPDVGCELAIASSVSSSTGNPEVFCPTAPM